MRLVLTCHSVPVCADHQISMLLRNITAKRSSAFQTSERCTSSTRCQRQLFTQKRQNSIIPAHHTQAYENPADLAAIQAGWDTLGDFKLKSDPDYIVPEAQRIDAGKKHAQMLRLTEAMHRHTRAFNAQVLDLRARREGARGALEADVERMLVINKRLG